MGHPDKTHKKWLLGDKALATKLSGVNLTHEGVVAPVSVDGDFQEPAINVPAGRATWPIDPDSHYGVSGISCDAFFAEYIVSEQKAYLLDDVGSRHTGQRPLQVGKNLILPRPITQDSYVLIVRTAEYGTAGIDKNVAMAVVPKTGPLTPELIAHHLSPSPNVNSSLVADPDGNGRKGPIDDQWRVRGYNAVDINASNRTGKTLPPQDPPPPPDPNEYAVMLNCTLSGVGQNRGMMICHFAVAEARMSYESSGPLRPASRKHLETITKESDINAGAISTNAYYTNGSEYFDGPLDFEHVEEPDVQDPPGMPIRVHLQMDSDKIHDFILGKRNGVWRWHVHIPTVKTPPCQDESSPAEVVPNSDGRIEPGAVETGGSAVYMLESFMNVGWDGLPRPGIHKMAR